jgi:hypothetical protein
MKRIEQVQITKPELLDAVNKWLESENADRKGEVVIDIESTMSPTGLEYRLTFEPVYPPDPAIP